MYCIQQKAEDYWLTFAKLYSVQTSSLASSYHFIRKTLKIGITIFFFAFKKQIKVCWRNVGHAGENTSEPEDINKGWLTELWSFPRYCLKGTRKQQTVEGYLVIKCFHWSAPPSRPLCLEAMLFQIQVIVLSSMVSLIRTITWAQHDIECVFLWIRETQFVHQNRGRFVRNRVSTKLG